MTLSEQLESSEASKEFIDMAERLEDDLQEAKDDLKDKGEECRTLRAVAEAAVEKLADLGVIVNTPQMKRMYIDGEREIPR